jgi:hypothetical protein
MIGCALPLPGPVLWHIAIWTTARISGTFNADLSAEAAAENTLPMKLPIALNTEPKK